MKLIVGLGNPGPQYEQTRHNIGFMAVDKLAASEGFGQWKTEKRCQARINHGTLAAEPALLAKPETFMNDSGRAVAAIMRYYKIKPADVIIIQDELDIPLGSFKISHNVSAAGHNGIQSIIDALKTRDLARFRVGIGGPSERHASGADYVLQKFLQSELAEVDKILALVVEAIECAITSGLAEAMNEFN